MLTSEFLEPVNMLPYMVKRGFTDVNKLKILRWRQFLRLSCNAGLSL